MTNENKFYFLIFFILFLVIMFLFAHKDLFNSLRPSDAYLH